MGSSHALSRDIVPLSTILQSRIIFMWVYRSGAGGGVLFDLRIIAFKFT
jgi:hypothetical protein